MIKRASIACGVSVLAMAFAAHAAAPVKAKIDSGVLVGSGDAGVNVFKGVPFAKPPVGELRWAPPQVPAKWASEYDATQFKLPCPQTTNPDGKTPNGGGVAGATQEDCLYLNVWAPANAKNAPVMLWLYGGAGTLGAGHLGSYNGTSFARQGVIIVTINYRLGNLGNFAHPALTQARRAGEPMSNYALMDAIAGLQWVQRNIGAFGGDKNNVTLFGQSAGGAMVSSLLSSPAAKGLYHKAIVHSGASITAGTPLAAAEKSGVETAAKMGLGPEATLAQLRALPADVLVKNNANGMRSVLDGTVKTVTTKEAYATGAAIKVPIIVGSNNGEGGVDGANALVNMAAAAGAPAYQYYFTYVPAWRTAEQPNGAPHSAEIPYAFAALNTSTTGGGARVTDHDREVSARMNSCWVAFAKASVTARQLSCADGFVWQARTPQNDAIAVFGERPALAQATPIIKEALARAPARPAPGAPATTTATAAPPAAAPTPASTPR
jgi:para-nitrobenzyl esterase